MQNDARALVKHQRWRDLPKAVKDHVKADVSAVTQTHRQLSFCHWLTHWGTCSSTTTLHRPSSLSLSPSQALQLVPSLSASHAAPRTAAAQAIAKLGKIEVPEGAWPELVDGLVGAAMSDAVPEATKTASLTAIGFLCEEIVRSKPCALARCRQAQDAGRSSTPNAPVNDNSQQSEQPPATS